MKLTDFQALTFDCYGTLIDWETGLYQAFQPLLHQARVNLSRDEVLAEFGRAESEQQRRTPGMIYTELLAQVHRTLARQWGVDLPQTAHMAFGRSIPDWPAFADTTAALQYLKRHYKLFILSNVDRVSFAATQRRLGIEFDGIYTAQDIGSYKPDLQNFHYLLQRLGEQGIARERVLHTAQSLFHDHAPANALGIASAWIDRRHEQAGWGATIAPPKTPHYDFRFVSLAEMAEAHRQADH